MKLIFRSQALLHQVLNQFAMNSLPFGASAGYLVLISAGFTIVRSDNFVFRALLLVFSLSLCGALSLLFNLMYQITIRSSEFIQSFKSSTTPKKPIDQRFFTSCKPVYTYLGRCCLISRNTFPAVMHEIVINALITLLLTIPVTNISG